MPKRPPLRCVETNGDCVLAIRNAATGDRTLQGPDLEPLPAVPGVPDQVILACRDTIIAGAMPHDPVRVDTVSVGKLSRQEAGGMVAPLFVRIVYARQGGYEVRQANVKCRLDSTGTVSSLA